jgi:dipeptidyl-peptidase-4
MYTKLILAQLILTLAAPTLYGADPKPAKDAPLDATFLRAYAETRGFMLGRPVKPKPTPDGKAVLFLRAQARVPKQQLYEFDVATGKTRELLTPEMVLKGAEEHLTPEEKARRERQRVNVGGFTDFQISDDGSLILVSLSGKLYVVKRDGGQVRELSTGAGTILDPKFSPDGKHVGYVRDNDVYVIGVDGDKEQRVTSGGSDKKTHGLAEFVAQEEMSRFSGYWWSPDSKHIAYEEADVADVEVWHVADPIHPEQTPTPTFYPRPGKDNVKVRLGVVPVGGGDTVWIKWDVKNFEYLTDVRWDKIGGLTLCVQTREQDELLLLRADPKTGKTTTLVTEKDPAWVAIDHDTPRWVEDGSFFWSGQGKGGSQLEHRDAAGRLIDVVVDAAAGYRGLVDVDWQNGEIVFRASQNPTEEHLFKLSLEGGKPVALTKEPGVYTAVFSKKHDTYVQQANTPAAMPKTTVRRANGTVSDTLPSVAEEPPTTPNSEMVKVGDDRSFYAYIVRPHNFDPQKRYPVIDYVYGGPGHQQVLATMNTRLLPQWIADQGFIVVAIDNRGTPGRGRDWERAVSRKFGSVPLDDQVAGLKALGAKYPEMDMERVGVYGWSFGGYLSALAVLRRPDMFKAAVAGAPVVDWLDYDTHYTERYLGLPKRDAAAYKEASLLTYAADLKRPLLLVHGTADDNVYFRHTLKLTNALFREGKDFDLLPLPGLTHMVPDPVVMERLYGRFAVFFQKHLGKPEAKAKR